jgi:hypothetical protein
LLQDYVYETTQTFVTSDRFPEVWEQMNRAAHPVVSAVLMGEGTESISTAEGQITLDLAPLMTEVKNRLVEHGLDIVARIQIDQLDTTFVIYESEDLANLQDIVGVLESLAIALPVLAIGSLGASLGLSTHRRRTLVWAGLGLAGAMAVLLTLFAFARWWVIDNLSAGVDRAAATAFFETIGRYLRDAARLLGLIGLAIAAVAFATRPAGWVSRERKHMRRSARTAWHTTKAKWPEFGQAGSWVNAHLVGLSVALGVGCCLLIIARDPLAADRATVILLIAAIGFGALAVLHARLGAVAVPSAGHPPYGADGGTVVRVMPGPVSTVEDVRAELAELAGELSADDVRVLRRVAVALRDAPVARV